MSNYPITSLPEPNYMDRYYELKSGFIELCKKYELQVPHVAVGHFGDNNDDIRWNVVAFMIDIDQEIEDHVKSVFIRWLMEYYYESKDKRVVEILTDYLKDDPNCDYYNRCMIPEFLEGCKKYCLRVL